MPRLPSNTDFTVTVDGVGRFTFGQRKMRDELAIQREFARIIDGVEPTAFLQAVGVHLEFQSRLRDVAAGSQRDRRILLRAD